METHLADFIRGTAAGDSAEAIIRKCVHCGFCNATCPTYQLLGDELDGPRGRIYQIKQMLEGSEATVRTLRHLDRCLTCRACETTCPSGVEYAKLLDIGREVAVARIGRSPLQRMTRWSLRAVMTRTMVFAALLGLGRAVRALLPAALRALVPSRVAAGEWPAPRHARRMLVLDGCVQPALAPRINAAAARVLDRLGISLVRVAQAGCCGALGHHLDAPAEALGFVRRAIDAWWPHVEQGAEAIVMTASGCGVMVKDYGYLLRDDPVYAGRAARISAMTRDVAEVLMAERGGLAGANRGAGVRVAFHSPCTLQHGQGLVGVVESILGDAGFELTRVADAHLCCGSAGTYSILQPALSGQLRERKLAALQADAPALIASANIGCLMHLQSASTTPVRHWIEVLDEALES
ncbi:MAG: glycolate oxidase subunit GlcF [Gammaproteobacteria bacterium]|nr:glycolate oxidase subunit GlcF [Gammaproteobacteria bacterium]